MRVKAQLTEPSTIGTKAVPEQSWSKRNIVKHRIVRDPGLRMGFQLPNSALKAHNRDFFISTVIFITENISLSRLFREIGEGLVLPQIFDGRFGNHVPWVCSPLLCLRCSSRETGPVVQTSLPAFFVVCSRVFFIVIMFYSHRLSWDGCNSYKRQKSL